MINTMNKVLPILWPAQQQDEKLTSANEKQELNVLIRNILIKFTSLEIIINTIECDVQI